MTNMVLQSQASWGSIGESEQGQAHRPKEPDQPRRFPRSYMADGGMREILGPFPTCSAIGSKPIIYPFSLGGSISYLVSQCRFLDLRVDSAGNQVVGLAIQ